MKPSLLFAVLGLTICQIGNCGVMERDKARIAFLQDRLKHAQEMQAKFEDLAWRNLATAQSAIKTAQELQSEKADFILKRIEQTTPETPR